MALAPVFQNALRNALVGVPGTIAPPRPHQQFVAPAQNLPKILRYGSISPGVPQATTFTGAVAPNTFNLTSPETFQPPNFGAGGFAGPTAGYNPAGLAPAGLASMHPMAPNVTGIGAASPTQAAGAIPSGSPGNFAKVLASGIQPGPGLTNALQNPQLAAPNPFAKILSNPPSPLNTVANSPVAPQPNALAAVLAQAAQQGIRINPSVGVTRSFGAF